MVALALWSFAFLKVENGSEADIYSIYHWFVHLLDGVPLIQPVAAIILIVVQAVVLNNLINKNQLIVFRTFVPSLIYIVLMSSIPELLHFNPGLIGNLLFILMLDRLFSTYRDDNSNSKIFDAGLYLGLASTVQFSFLMLLIFGWLSLVILRPFAWRDMTILTIGALVPYSFIATYYYAFRDLQSLIPHFVLFDSLDAYQHLYIPIHYSPLLIALGGLILIAFKPVFLEWRIGVVKVKKRMSALALFSGLAVLFTVLDLGFYIALAIPLSVYLSIYFINTQKKLLAEVLFLLLIISIVYLHIVTL